MNLNVDNVPVHILDTEQQLVKEAVAMALELPEGSTIALWPDQVGRQIFIQLGAKCEKHLNCFTLGSIKGLDLAEYLRPVLNQLRKDKSNSKVKIIQSLPKQIDLCFLQPRPTTLDAALITPNTMLNTYKTQFFIDEIGTAYGYEREGASTRSDAETSESDMASPGNLNGCGSVPLSQVLVDDLIERTKQFCFVFKGDLYKDACATVLETGLGLCGKILTMCKEKKIYVKCLADVLSSSCLKLIQQPWTRNGFEWSPRAAKMAFCQVAARLNKKVKDLTLDDFKQLSIQITRDEFEKYQSYTIQDITDRMISIKDGFFPSDKHLKVIVFSPHPDDDVISAGAAVISLAMQPNIELHLTYCVSGAVAVPDSFVMDKINQFKVNVVPDHDNLAACNEDQIAYCAEPIANSSDPNKITEKHYITHDSLTAEEAQERFSSGLTPKSKQLLREIEAMSALDCAGMFKKPRNQAHFLRLPFYGTGFGRRNSPQHEDVMRVVRLLKEVNPDVIFLAGDLSDPHGTHGFCYFTIKDAFEIYEGEIKDPQQCSVFNTRIIQKEKTVQQIREQVGQRPVYKLMYRGAWSEFNIEDSTFILTFDKQEMEHKMQVIQKHYSQMGEALYLGGDKRAFDVRAEERNKMTAKFLKALGFADDGIEGAECFVGCGQLP